MYPPQKVLITGSSGLIGSMLVNLLESKGFEIIKLSFSKNEKGFLYWNPYKSIIPLTDFSKINIVINLAGENINQYWTQSAKKRIYDSRIKSTELLSSIIAQSQKPPQLFINASGISCYAFSPDKPSTEQSPLSHQNNFLSHVINDWESATNKIDQSKTRLILLRTGMVLSTQGGALSSLLPLFKCGLGGPQGPGNQLINWIDIVDLINAIYFCITNDSIHGPVNMVAPEVITNDQFSKTLAHALNRPSWLKTPSFLLKLLLGELAQNTILSNSNVFPQKLLDHGFQFQFNSLPNSLHHLLISQN